MSKLPKAKSLYIIIRGEKSEFHNAPYHPIIVCSRKHVAKWESKDAHNGATVLYNAAGISESGNWFLGQYKGYGCESNRYLTLFDGVDSRDFTNKERVERELLNGAVWWSYDECPRWMLDLGVKYPEDDFSKKVIMSDYGDCLLPYSQADKLRRTLENYDTPEWLMLNNEQAPDECDASKAQ
jgi:hypothetical protein